MLNSSPPSGKETFRLLRWTTSNRHIHGGQLIAGGDNSVVNFPSVTRSFSASARECRITRSSKASKVVIARSDKAGADRLAASRSLAGTTLQSIRCHLVSNHQARFLIVRHCEWRVVKPVAAFRNSINDSCFRARLHVRRDVRTRFEIERDRSLAA